jgi:predicted signal transduction protein with EAL and GGDEF domain
VISSSRRAGGSPFSRNTSQPVELGDDLFGIIDAALVMDAFGTGYSSFSYLARFAFDKIKIDRQFVRNMARDPEMRAIVKTIIALGKPLDVSITPRKVSRWKSRRREFG